MNYSMIRYILCKVLWIEGVFFLMPAMVAAIYSEEELFIYLYMSIGAIVLGLLGRKKPKNEGFYTREGFVTVSLSWVVLSLVGAMPMYLTGEIPTYTNALFETISGFTTTGSSILSNVEALSRATAFWRCFTHWIGGMGVLVFILAVMPLSGGSNIHLMRAESPGPSVGKLVPKIKQTAKYLYLIYAGITITEMIALFIAGMDLYESVTLSFATAGTGGFALLNSSIASYSIAVQNIITIFMILCAVNFNVYYYLLMRKAKDAFINEEVRYYLVIVFTSAIMIAINIKDSFSGILSAFQSAIFQVASVISTTGFATADFDKWPEFSKAILVLLMFVGACAGSTGGGFKVSRILILIKAVKNEILSIVHPRSVQNIRINGKKLQSGIVKSVLCYFALYVLILIGSILVISLDNFDFTTNFTAVLATLNNIGAGLGVVGYTGNFGAYSDLSKFVLMFDMLVGRLELFPMLILFAPGVWRLPILKSEKKSRIVSTENSESM